MSPSIDQQKPHAVYSLTGDRPLSLGGSGSDIPIPNTQSVVACVALSRSPYIQPAPGTHTPIQVDGQPIQQSSWLRDGQRIDIGSEAVLIICNINQKWQLALHLSAAARERTLTLPQENRAQQKAQQNTAGKKKRPRKIFHLQIAGRDAGEQTVPLDSYRPRPVVIGNSAEADVMIPVPELSSRQAVVSWQEDQLILETGLGEGRVRLNREIIAPKTRVRLQSGDRFDVAGVQFQLSEGKAASLSPADEEAADMDTRTRTGPASLLALVEAKRQGNGIILIGRHPDCDIVLNDPTISKHHAAIECHTDGSLVVRDCESSNGTYLNGERLRGSHVLHRADLLLVGPFQIQVKSGVKDIRKESAIQAIRIRKVYPNGYVGLQDATITVTAGTLMAVMGPSGCGKSTLLKCMNGDMPATEGKVLIHGLDLITHYEYLKNKIGYVPQDDIVHGDLTVEQSLFFAAKLRLENTNTAHIRKKIDDVLQRLGIEHIRKNKVKGISGGQRKRVCIAVELLTDPLILFLDEPTSPLDPQTIEEFLGILQRLAAQGTTVIMVTHKPEDLHFMDSVVFLAKGGHMVYNGQADQYCEYFGVDHAVGVFATIDQDAEQWIQDFRLTQDTSQPHIPAAGQPAKGKGKPWFVELGWLTARYLCIKTSDLVNTGLLISQAPIIAGLICLIFSELSLAVLFFCTISAIWFGANNAAREIVGELAIYRRERMFNLKLMPYIGSKMIVLTLFSAIQAGIYIAILWLRYRGSEVPLEHPLKLFSWMVLVSASATALGLALSAKVDSTEKVMTLVPIVLLPQIMLAGVVARVSNAMVECLSYLALSRWAMNGFGLIQGNVHGVIDPTLADEAKREGAIHAIDGGPEKLGPHGELLLDPGGGLDDNYHMDLYDKLGDLANNLATDMVVVVCFGAICLGFVATFLWQKDSIKVTPALLNKPSRKKGSET